MTSPAPRFSRIERGFARTVLLLPGWATDCRIFGALELDFNYLMPDKVSPAGFAAAAAKALDREGIEKASVLGWSMGGYLACDLYRAHPSRVEEVVLVGMRERYEPAQIAAVREYIARSPAGYLCRFFGECFSGGEKDLASRFRTDLMKSYLRDIDTAALLEGLDYLAAACLDGEWLANAPVRFIHGGDDRIAPIETLAGIRQKLPASRFRTIEGAGHMPFLRKEFREAFHGR